MSPFLAWVSFVVVRIESKVLHANHALAIDVCFLFISRHFALWILAAMSFEPWASDMLGKCATTAPISTAQPRVAKLGLGPLPPDLWAKTHPVHVSLGQGKKQGREAFSLHCSVALVSDPKLWAHKASVLPLSSTQLCLYWVWGRVLPNVQAGFGFMS